MSVPDALLERHLLCNASVSPKHACACIYTTENGSLCAACGPQTSVCACIAVVKDDKRCESKNNNMRLAEQCEKQSADPRMYQPRDASDAETIKKPFVWQQQKQLVSLQLSMASVVKTIETTMHVVARQAKQTKHNAYSISGLPGCQTIGKLAHAAPKTT